MANEMRDRLIELIGQLTEDETKQSIIADHLIENGVVVPPYEKCKPLRLDFSDSVNPNHTCQYFKNKADFVEVVRCKDCVCFSYFIEPVKGYIGKCGVTQVLKRDDNFFCRDGVRKMAQRIEGADNG